MLRLLRPITTAVYVEFRPACPIQKLYAPGFAIGLPSLRGVVWMRSRLGVSGLQNTSLCAYAFRLALPSGA